MEASSSSSSSSSLSAIPKLPFKPSYPIRNRLIVTPIRKHLDVIKARRFQNEAESADEKSSIFLKMRIKRTENQDRAQIIPSADGSKDVSEAVELLKSGTLDLINTRSTSLALGVLALIAVIIISSTTLDDVFVDALIKVVKESLAGCHEMKYAKIGGIASKPFLHGEQSRSFHGIPILPNRRLLPSRPRASTNEPRGLTGKPTFWWRILACIPYLLDTCLFVETVRCIHPFSKGLEFCNWPLLLSPLRIPRWFMLLYALVGGLVVERKEWPYFFRSHVLMSFLPVTLFLTALDGSQALGSWMNAGYMSQCWKSRLYWGKIGMHLFLFTSFAFMLLILECMRCALCGMHIHVCIDGA